MGLSAAVKVEIVERFGRAVADTGSSAVQIALLTAHITQLTAHLKVHQKDVHSRRGLIGLVSRRRRLMRYLKICDPAQYAKIVETLALRG